MYLRTLGEDALGTQNELPHFEEGHSAAEMRLQNFYGAHLASETTLRKSGKSVLNAKIRFHILRSVLWRCGRAFRKSRKVIMEL